MAILPPSKEFKDFFSDNPYVLEDNVNNHTGIHNGIYGPNSIQDALNSTKMVSNPVVIPKEGSLIIDDMVISAHELRIYMKVLRKLAMEEMPEEFI